MGYTCSYCETHYEEDEVAECSVCGGRHGFVRDTPCSECTKLRAEVGHWQAKAKCYGDMVHGCAPVLERAGYPVCSDMPSGAVGGVAASCSSLLLEVERSRKVEAAAEAWLSGDPAPGDGVSARCLWGLIQRGVTPEQYDAECRAAIKAAGEGVQL